MPSEFIIRRGDWEERISCDYWYQEFDKYDDERVQIVMEHCKRMGEFAFTSHADISFVHGSVLATQVTRKLLVGPVDCIYRVDMPKPKICK